MFDLPAPKLEDIGAATALLATAAGRLAAAGTVAIDGGYGILG